MAPEVSTRMPEPDPIPANRVPQARDRRYPGGRWAMYGLGICITIVVWWVATKFGGESLAKFAPDLTASALREQLSNGRFWEGVWATLQRLGVGLGIAFIIGFPVGLAVGYSPRANQLSYVSFQFLRMISPLSWTPVAIILLGLGSEPVYFLISIAAVWPIIINTAAGVRAADAQWIEVVRCLGAGHWEILRHVLIRAALPNVLVGLQLALGVAWIVIVPAEMLGVSSGLGYMILDFRDVNDYASIMAVIVVIGLIGVMLDLPLRTAIRRASWD